MATMSLSGLRQTPGDRRVGPAAAPEGVCSGGSTCSSSRWGRYRRAAPPSSSSGSAATPTSTASPASPSTWSASSSAARLPQHHRVRDCRRLTGGAVDLPIRAPSRHGCSSIRLETPVRGPPPPRRHIPWRRGISVPTPPGSSPRPRTLPPTGTVIRTASSRADVRAGGRPRRGVCRRVARLCQDYGQRVQYSVFECHVDPTADSLRFYRLGANWRSRVEHTGAKASYDPEWPPVRRRGLKR